MAMQYALEREDDMEEFLVNMARNPESERYELTRNFVMERCELTRNLENEASKELTSYVEVQASEALTRSLEVEAYKELVRKYESEELFRIAAGVKDDQVERVNDIPEGYNKKNALYAKGARMRKLCERFAETELGKEIKKEADEIIVENLTQEEMNEIYRGFRGDRPEDPNQCGPGGRGPRDGRRGGGGGGGSPPPSPPGGRSPPPSPPSGGGGGDDDDDPQNPGMWAIAFLQFCIDLFRRTCQLVVKERLT